MTFSLHISTAGTLLARLDGAYLRVGLWAGTAVSGPRVRRWEAVFTSRLKRGSARAPSMDSMEGEGLM